MFARRITNRNDALPPQDSGFEELTPERISKLRWWEVRARERVMRVGGEIVRQELFSRIYDSPLGMAIHKEVRARLDRLDGQVTDPVSLSKIGNNVALEVVNILPDEDFEKGDRSLTDPDFIYQRGGLCVEMSMVAEVAMHLAYNLSDPRPGFSGSTQEVVLRTLSDDGIHGHHAVLKVEFMGGDGEKQARCCDPVNGIECSWEEFMSGSQYTELSGRPTEIVFALNPIEFA